MSLRFRALSFLSLLLFVAVPQVQAQEYERYVHVPFNISLWRGISIGDAVARDSTVGVIHTFSLNLPVGQAAQLNGVAVGVFSTVYTESARGLQVAGLANVAGEEADGFQVAGLANVAGERVRGIQMAGLANVAGEGGGFFQSAGLANVAGGDFTGIQTAGLANVASEAFRGVQTSGLASIIGEGGGGLQASGLANMVGEDFGGIQTAGLVNITGEDVWGLQAAGLANVVGGTLRGVQTGVFNVASESAGLQLGVVNVAGEQRGVPVGLYGYSEGTPVRLDVWADETAGLHVGIRSGSRVVSNFVGIAARPFSDAAYRWGTFAGLGIEQPVGDRMRWGLDAMFHTFFAEDFGADGGNLVRLRAHLTYALNRDVAVFGGPSLSLFWDDDHDGDDLAPWTFYEDDGDTYVRAWAGLVGGLRFRLR